MTGSRLTITRPTIEKPGEKDLIQELQEYTENWVNRMRLLRPTHEPQTIAQAIFDELYRHIIHSAPPTPPIPQQIHEFIMSHLRQGITLKGLSKFLGYSEKYCSELFQTQMGESFTLYLRRVRIEKAKHLLEDDSIGHTYIAETLGFGDQFAFSHFFKKATGRSPRHYRAHIRNTRKEHTPIDPLEDSLSGRHSATPQ
ncbi:MAG: AraC family transcriptional regulator [Nitrospirales bacterium]|nr:helix-turn-helix transcriptional regulator [Nitrospira sp.]MDR4500339.1 AraC family transcriptional regulator [Nitrospirales bacterium]